MVPPIPEMATYELCCMRLTSNMHGFGGLVCRCLHLQPPTSCATSNSTLIWQGGWGKGSTCCQRFVKAPNRGLVNPSLSGKYMCISPKSVGNWCAPTHTMYLNEYGHRENLSFPNPCAYEEINNSLMISMQPKGALGRPKSRTLAQSRRGTLDSRAVTTRNFFLITQVPRHHQSSTQILCL